MVIDLLKDYEKEELIKTFEENIKKGETIEVYNLSASKVFDVLDKVEGVEIEPEDFIVSGWEADYWSSFVFNGEKWGIFGTMYDATVKIEKVEEEE